MDTAPPPRGPRRVSAGTLHVLDRCDRRLWLESHAGDEAAPSSEYGRSLREKSRAHERAVVSRFVGVEAPFLQHGQSLEACAEATRVAFAASRAPLWRPVFLSPDGRLASTPCLLLRAEEGLVLHEAKLALRPHRRRETAVQMRHHAEVIRAATGEPVVRAEATNGAGEVVALNLAGEPEWREAVARAQACVAEDAAEPRTLLGHSECETCPFYRHCWDEAERENRVDILPEVWRARARELRTIGIASVADLAACEPEQLARTSFAGHARNLVLAARAHRDHSAVWLKHPRLPEGRPLVWLDFEGDALGEAADVPIYLWGLAVEPGRTLSERRPEVESLFADFDEGGDRRGWERFLARVEEILESMPDAVWVHWHDTEVLWMRRYAQRYGAPRIVLDRLLRGRAFVDLHAVIERSVRLPLRSYSIKHVAPWMGFQWSNPEAGSEWSVAQYERARETKDAAERESRLAAIAAYNADDLWAMRAVWRWLLSSTPVVP